MFVEIGKKELLAPLKMLAGVVEQRQTLPILANALMRVEEGVLHLTATDSEVEIVCSLPLDPGCEAGATTVPAKKLFDICRSLNEEANIQILHDDTQVKLKSGKSRFTLSCLPAEDFPASPEINSQFSFSLPQATLREVLTRTQFAMAVQDVRYYLNGLLLDLQSDQLSVVATDGHRLAMVLQPFDLPEHEPLQVIVPRKAVVELNRLLDGGEGEVNIAMDNHHVSFQLGERLTLTSKLIDGRFPDYHSVLPLNPNKIVGVQTQAFKSALTRAAILSNEKYKGVRLQFDTNILTISARNPEQEEAEEVLEITYTDEAFEIGFNVTYLLDALNALNHASAELCFTDPSSSCLLRPADNEQVKYVIMPMRL